MDEVGSKLRDARVAKNLSLEDIATTTKIPRTSLENLEASNFGVLPAPVFVRGFIRAYARVVGADANAMVRLYEASAAPELHPSDGFRPATYGARGESGATDGASDGRSRIERHLDPRRKLVPLQPVSDRYNSGLRPGYTLLAVVAVGLLIAAWLLVGGKNPGDDGVSARTPHIPALEMPIGSSEPGRPADGPAARAAGDDVDPSPGHDRTTPTADSVIQRSGSGERARPGTTRRP